jgi:hypothetical protein
MYGTILMNIGRVRRNVDIASEYFRLAQEDEQIGLLLKDTGKYRHSLYFVIQAMEKYVRSKIFAIIDAKNSYFREKNRNHSIEDAIDFFVEIVSMDSYIRKQVREQLDKYVLDGIKFNLLHNDLRYPFYSERFNSYSSLDVTKEDTETVLQRLNFLKKFLQDVDRFR